MIIGTMEVDMCAPYGPYCRIDPVLRKIRIESMQYPQCGDVNKYEKLYKIGQGTYGEVFKGRNKTTEKILALKKVLVDNQNEGFPITALREVQFLRELKHENVINLIEVVKTQANVSNNYNSTFYLVFDFCHHDLAGLLSNTDVKFSLSQVKKVMQQILNGLFFIHTKRIMHRDMKSANILLTKAGVIKLADLGMARRFHQRKDDLPNRYTNRVVTLWYRPPELLLGDRNYGPAVDIWGAGCIMAEMWTRIPVMPGASEQQQISLISQLCGSINPQVWPGVEKLALYTKLDLLKGQHRKVVDKFRNHIQDRNGCDLLDKLLTLDPSKRIDANSALDHDYFWTDPMPSDLGVMLQRYNENMFVYNSSSRRAVICPRPPPRRPPLQQLQVEKKESWGTSFHDRVF